MDKVIKLKLFHNHANAQGIKVVVNTGTSAFSPTLMVTIIPVMSHSPIRDIKAYTSTPEVD